LLKLLFLSVALILVLILIALYAYTVIKSANIVGKYPAIGKLYDIDGVKIHAIYKKLDTPNNKPPLVFIHGASGNLRDQMTPFYDRFVDTADMLFVDRPGHGWSERGSSDNRYPDRQAQIIAKLMEKLEILNAIIVGHSFGGAVAASFALNHADKVHSLLFLAPVAYPWPGGVRWYYSLTSWPIIGHLFANTLALPAGLKMVETGARCVFLPNKMPDDYVKKTGPSLVLRPKSFRANAQDISSLLGYLEQTWPRYKQIKAPTIIISGDKDNVVFPYIHSNGLAWHIEGSELISLDNMGHKPDYAAASIVEAAIDKLSGNTTIDLTEMARELDEKLSRQIVDLKYDP
jgi:pimeloyl-ACP methyl ester carboxylesterase